MLELELVLIKVTVLPVEIVTRSAKFSNCSRETMLKLLGSACCQHDDLGVRMTL